MDHRELEKLVQLMNENELAELEIEQEGLRVCLRKAGLAPPLPAGYAAAPAPGQAPAGEGAGAQTPDGPPPGTKEIRSPMVGTFYRRPNPEAEPFVDIGSGVEGDTVVCIVEAMKVNNEIKAELTGSIVEILVEDGQPVEFDEPLFRVKVG